MLAGDLIYASIYCAGPGYLGEVQGPQHDYDFYEGLQFWSNQSHPNWRSDRL